MYTSTILQGIDSELCFVAFRNEKSEIDKNVVLDEDIVKEHEPQIGVIESNNSKRSLIDEFMLSSNCLETKYNEKKDTETQSNGRMRKYLASLTSSVLPSFKRFGVLIYVKPKVYFVLVKGL